MNPASSPARLKAIACLVVLLWTSQNSVFGYQRQAKTAKKKVQTSADSSFDPAKIDKLAVIVVGNNPARPMRTQSDQQRLVEDEFVEILIQKGFSLVSRSDIQAVAKEQQFQRSGLTEDDAAALGKLLNVPAVLVLRITDSTTENQRNPRTGTNMIIGRASMGARLVSVETGGVLWTSNHTESGPVRGRGDASLVLADVAKNIALAFPQKGPDKGGTPGSTFDPVSLTKLAVVVVGNNRTRLNEIQSDQQRLVEDEFLRALLDKGYSMVSRSDIAAVVKEQKFQQSGLTEDNAAAVGKLLNVPAVLVVRITECTAETQRTGKNSVLVGRTSLGARLVSVETGLIWWSRSLTDSDSLRSRGQLSSLLNRAAKNMAESFPDKKATSLKSDKKTAKSSADDQ